MAKETDLKKLAEQLVNLSVIEVNNLNQILKDEYGIEPVATTVVAAPSPSGQSDQAESTPAKDKFDIILKNAGEQKILVIKTVKEITDMALGEAKTLVESAPKSIKDGVAKEEAEEIKAKLEKAGAVVELA